MVGYLLSFGVRAVHNLELPLCLQLSQIGRCEYEKTCTLLVNLFDEAAQKYQELITTGNDGNDLTIQEGTVSCQH